MNEKKIKIAVVFHSVCGNTCQMAEQLTAALEQGGADALLYRLPDPGYAATADAFPASREYKEAITSVRLLESPGELLGCDGLLMGSPTYFGNVSAPVKTFMDSFVDYWTGAPFRGKTFGSFATSGTAQGGSEKCLDALNTFAMHIGMTLVSVPAAEGAPQPAYGLSHYSGDLSDIRLTGDETVAIKAYARHFLAITAALTEEKG